MGCVSEDDLLEYVERRLPPGGLPQIEAHLRDCEACRQLLAEVARSLSRESVVVEDGPAARYKLLEPIGAGGMGVVYAARDLKLHRQVALKMLRPGGAGGSTDAKMRERLLREARAMARLSHANVLPIFDVGELEGDVFFAMELVEGRTLRTWLHEKRRSWREVLDVFLPAARGLAGAHAAGVIHRDFKPDNVLIGNDGRVRVMDFGLASAAAPNAAAPDVGRQWQSLQSLRGTGRAGSPAYMAPEQMRGESADARADIFSYCVTLYEGFYGERPFAGDSVDELQNAVLRGEIREPRRGNRTPAWVRRIVVRGLHVAPAERFQSMGAIIAALEKGRSGARTRTVIAGTMLAATVALGWFLFTPTIRRALFWATFSGNTAKGQPTLQAGAGAAQVQSSPKSNSESYDLYLRGKIQLRRRNEKDTQAAIRLLEQAVSLDPNFAAAQAELAYAYGQWLAWLAPDDKHAIERAELAEAKALRLDPDLPEAHFVAASLLWVAIPPRFAHERAVREVKRALALNKDYAQARDLLGNIYIHIGLFDLGVEELRKARDLDPTSHQPTFHLAHAHIYRGEYEEGLRLFRQIPAEANSSGWYYGIAWTLQYLGRSQEAWNAIEKYLQAHPEDPGGNVTSTRAIWFAKAGNARRAETDIRAAIRQGRGFVHFHHTAYNVASAYALLGRPGPAVEWLRTAAEGGCPSYPQFASDPNLERIRSDERYITLMRELKPQWERYQTMF